MVTSEGVVGNNDVHSVVGALVLIAARAPVLPGAHLMAGSLCPLLVVVQTQRVGAVVLQREVSVRVCKMLG